MIKRQVLLNQVTGPLFRELAEGIASEYSSGCLLYTGDPDQVRIAIKEGARIEIYAAPSYDRRSNLRRLISWFRYMLGTTRIVLLQKPGDAFLVVSNPPLVGPWIWLLTFFRSTNYSMLVYDIHPNVLVAAGKLKPNGVVDCIWRFLNRRVYRGANVIITLGSRMAKTIEAQIGTNGPPVEVIPPWVDVDRIKPIPREQNPHASKFVPGDATVVLYSGNMGASHDIDSILEAALMLKNRQDLFFLMIGGGEKFDHAVSFVSDNCLENIRVYPFQSEEIFPYTLALGDIAIATLDVGMEALMVPSKSFFYLAAGAALIGIANANSELSDLIDGNDIGFRVAPGQPSDLASVIVSLSGNRELLVNFKENSRKLAVERFAREKGVRAFGQLLNVNAR